MAEGPQEGGCARARCALAALTMLWSASGCNAMKHAEDSAHQECAKQGKQEVILDRQQHDSGLMRSASVTLTCIDPRYVVYTSDTFGAKLYADARIKGALVVAIAPGSIAEKSYLKVEDVIYEFDGTPINSAAELRSAVLAVPAGQQVLIKFHRTQYERGAYAQF